MDNKSDNYDCDKKLRINIIAPQQRIFRISSSFYINNEKKHVISPKQFYTIFFNVLVQTSVPTTCVLWCDPILYHQQIFHKINIIKANDQFLSITLYNNNNHDFVIQPWGIQVAVNIIMGSCSRTF